VGGAIVIVWAMSSFSYVLLGCGVWGVGKETSFISGGEKFFIRTDLIMNN
jgi:hypothetical protein